VPHPYRMGVSEIRASAGFEYVEWKKCLTI